MMKKKSTEEFAFFPQFLQDFPIFLPLFLILFFFHVIALSLLTPKWADKSQTQHLIISHTSKMQKSTWKQALCHLIIVTGLA